MKGVIFSAGKGTRFLPLTNTTPKALIPVLHKPVIYYALDALAPFVDEFIIITGHLENTLISTLGNSYHNISLTYISQGDMAGTAGALWSAKEVLQSQRFLTANCDDIFYADDIANMVKHRYAMGIYPLPRSFVQPQAFSIQYDTNGVLTQFARPQDTDIYINTATGVYLLDGLIFQEAPVQFATGEYGLPHTLKQFSKKNTVHTVLFSRWFSINSPEEKMRAEDALAHPAIIPE